MNILLIWDYYPDGTSFHILPFNEKWLRLHGRFLNEDGLSEADHRLILELDRLKGDPTPSCDIRELEVGYFIQTGVIL